MNTSRDRIYSGAWRKVYNMQSAIKHSTWHERVNVKLKLYFLLPCSHQCPWDVNLVFCTCLWGHLCRHQQCVNRRSLLHIFTLLSMTLPTLECILIFTSNFFPEPNNGKHYNRHTCKTRHLIVYHYEFLKHDGLTLIKLTQSFFGLDIISLLPLRSSPFSPYILALHVDVECLWFVSTARRKGILDVQPSWQVYLLKGDIGQQQWFPSLSTGEKPDVTWFLKARKEVTVLQVWGLTVKGKNKQTKKKYSVKYLCVFPI